MGANHCSEEGRPWHLRSLHPLPLQCPLLSLASPSAFNVLSLASPSSSSCYVTIIGANPFLFMCSQIKPSIASNSVDSPNLPNLGRKVNIWKMHLKSKFLTANTFDIFGGFLPLSLSSFALLNHCYFVCGLLEANIYVPFLVA